MFTMLPISKADAAFFQVGSHKKNEQGLREKLVHFQKQQIRELILGRPNSIFPSDLHGTVPSCLLDEMIKIIISGVFDQKKNNFVVEFFRFSIFSEKWSRPS